MQQQDIDYMMSNLQNYLQSHGYNTNKLFNCLNPLHKDNNASMKYFNDNKVYCFGCKQSYNLIDVISIIENVDKKEAFKRAIFYYTNNYIPQPKIREKTENYQKNAQNHEKNYKKAYIFWNFNLKRNVNALNYLQKRGISNSIIKRFNIGFNTFDFNDYKFDAIIIPINDFSFTARNINDDGKIRYYKSKGSHIELFNKNALTNHIPYCFITEGEFDCLSFETLGYNSLALGSVSNVNKFLKSEKDNNKTYILALDNDKAGTETTQEIVNFFKENNFKYKLFNNCECKDANQALMEKRPLFEKETSNLVKSILAKELEM